MAESAYPIRQLGEVTSFVYGKSQSAVRDANGTVPVYGTGGLMEYANQPLAIGPSVIVGRKGTLDAPRFVDGPFWAVDTTFYANPFEGSMAWLFRILTNLDLKQYNEATGVPSLARKTLERIPVPVPAPKVQHAIAVAIDCIDEHIDALSNKIAKRERVRAGLLQALLTRGIDENGEIREPSQCAYCDKVGYLVPKPWSVRKLGDCGHWSSGGTPPKSIEGYWDGPVPWISAKDMKTSCLRDSIDHISAEAIRFSKIATSGSVLMLVRGMALANDFPVAQVARDVAFNQDIKAIRTFTDIDASWLLMWLQNRREKIMRIANTSTHGTKKLDTADLKSLQVEVPPPDEQIEVVKAFRRQEEVTRSASRQLNKLRRLKTGIMRDLLSGRVSVEPLLELTSVLTAKGEEA